MIKQIKEELYTFWFYFREPTLFVMVKLLYLIIIILLLAIGLWWLI